MARSAYISISWRVMGGSIEDEEGGAGFGGDAVGGSGFVGDVVGHAGAEGEFGAVFVLDDDLAGDDEHDVAFAAPAVGDVFAAVVHEAKLDVAEFADAGTGSAGFAHVGGRREFGPIDGAGGEIVELHRLSRRANCAVVSRGNIPQAGEGDGEGYRVSLILAPR